MSGFEPPPPPPPACIIRGSQMFAGVVSSAETGGVSIAELQSGGDWELLALTGDSESGRAKVRWSSASPGLSLEGWVDARDLLFHAKHDVALIPGHLWIDTQASLKLRVEGSYAVVSPYATPFANIRATVSCSDLEVGDGDFERVVGAPAYWTSSQKTLSLYSAPKGQLLTTLAYETPSFDTRAYAALEEKNGFLHLLDYDGLHLDAWVKANEMKPWLGEKPEYPFVCGMGTLDLFDGSLRTMTEDAEVFLEPSITATPVGVIARGTRVHVVTSKKSFTVIEGEHRSWRGAAGKKLWVRSAAVGP